MELSTQTMEEIIELAEIERENEGAVLDVAYSGRAMWGGTCPAIRIDSQADLNRFFVAAGIREAQFQEATEHYNAPLVAFDAMELARHVRVDSMGFGLIAYWPDLKLTD